MHKLIRECFGLLLELSIGKQCASTAGTTTHSIQYMFYCTLKM